MTTATVDTDSDFRRLLAVGVTPRQVHHWTVRGYLQAHKAGPGSGYLRTYPHDEFDIARRMVKLTQVGLIPAVAARVARYQQIDVPAIVALLTPPREDHP